MRYVAIILASTFLAVVAAVGATAVEPQKAEAATVKGCTGKAVRLTTAESRMLALHNRTRANRNLPRLCVHPALQRAARAHSADMIRRDYFAHGNIGARLRNYGYRGRTYGENIAYGEGSRGAPGAIFKSWMRSPSHRPNILGRQYREIGIGAAYGNYKGDNVVMWTADFGSR